MLDTIKIKLNFDNRENTMNNTSVLRVQSLLAHGNIIIIYCAVQHLSAKLTLDVQVKCKKKLSYRKYTNYLHNKKITAFQINPSRFHHCVHVQYGGTNVQINLHPK